MSTQLLPREGMMAIVRNRRTMITGVESGTQVVEPSTPPLVESMKPMQLREFDALVRVARWSALTPTLPFFGLAKDCPPLAAPAYGAVALEAYQLVPLLRALEMPRVTLMLAHAVGLGKTIQAGLVLRELMLRRRLRRVLVISPITSYHYLNQPDVLEQFRAVAEPIHSHGTSKARRFSTDLNSLAFYMLGITYC